MSSAVPLVIKIADFDQADMKQKLDDCVVRDTDTYRSASGMKNLSLKDVFNHKNTQNKLRIEEGVQSKYDDDGKPGRVPTRILNSMLQPNHTVLIAWTAACAEAERLAGIYRSDLQHAGCQTLSHTPSSTDRAKIDTADSDVRQFMIVTGNCTQLRDVAGPGNLRISKDKQLVATHFDEFTSCVLVLWGCKTFRVCAPLSLLCKSGGRRARRGQVRDPTNERVDIDAAHCEDGEWYDIKLGPGDMMILPQNYSRGVYLVLLAADLSRVVAGACSCCGSCSCCCSLLRLLGLSCCVCGDILRPRSEWTHIFSP